MISLGTVDDEEYLAKAVPFQEIWTCHRLALNHGWESQGALQEQTGLKVKKM